MASTVASGQRARHVGEPVASGAVLLVAGRFHRCRRRRRHRRGHRPARDPRDLARRHRGDRRQPRAERSRCRFPSGTCMSSRRHLLAC